MIRKLPNGRRLAATTKHHYHSHHLKFQRQSIASHQIIIKVKKNKNSFLYFNLRKI